MYGAAAASLRGIKQAEYLHTIAEQRLVDDLLTKMESGASGCPDRSTQLSEFQPYILLKFQHPPNNLRSNTTVFEGRGRVGIVGIAPDFGTQA